MLKVIIWGGVGGVLVVKVPERDWPMILKEQTHKVHRKKGNKWQRKTVKANNSQAQSNNVVWGWMEGRGEGGEGRVIEKVFGTDNY